MPRERLRPTRRSTASDRVPGGSPSGAHRSFSIPAWRQTIDSFGGLTTIGAILGSILVVGAIFIANRPTSTSRDVADAPLRGTTIEASDPETDKTHVTDPALMRIAEGETPTRGPHFSVPQSVGVYEQPVPDGNAIHSLEHGMVRLSYNPSLVDRDTITKLEDLGKQYEADLIVAPRPDTASAIDIVSWGQILKLEVFDQRQLEEFIKTNRNRSPEPFVR